LARRDPKPSAIDASKRLFLQLNFGGGCEFQPGAWSVTGSGTRLVSAIQGVENSGETAN
jgi:hypothetical protein